MAALYHPGVDPSRVYYGTDTRAGGLLFGAAPGVLLGAQPPAGPGRSVRADPARPRRCRRPRRPRVDDVVHRPVPAGRLALPGRVRQGRAGHRRGHRRRRPPRGAPRRAARVPPAALDRAPFLRAVPLALARVPAHPARPRHRAHRRPAPRLPTGHHLRPGRGVVPVRRDADPHRGARPPVEAVAGPAAGPTTHQRPRRHRRRGGPGRAAWGCWSSPSCGPSRSSPSTCRSPAPPTGSCRRTRTPSRPSTTRTEDAAGATAVVTDRGFSIPALAERLGPDAPPDTTTSTTAPGAAGGHDAHHGGTAADHRGSRHRHHRARRRPQHHRAR